MAKAPKAGTVGDAIDDNHVIRIFCEDRGCRRVKEVDLEAVAKRHGRDLPLQRLLERSRCSVCEGRWPALDLQAVPKDTPGIR